MPDSPNGSGDRGGDEVSSYHRSVMPSEVVHYMQPVPGMVILDCTLGGGGHSRSLLEAGSRVIGLDRDADALAETETLLSGYGDAFTGIQTDFREFGQALDDAKVGGLDGILLDLGVSSHQLDRAERGFSFRHDGPLDMRMDVSRGETAADLVNRAPAEELERLFRELGEEWRAKKISQVIVRHREEEGSFQTTLQLADLIEKTIGRHGRRHPATKVFQALRMSVNDELGALDAALSGVRRWLRPGGRLVVITFHSLEDRIVKNFMRDASRKELDRPEWPEPKPNPDWFLKPVFRRALPPTSEEIASNPRARSAKLRVAERIDPNASK